jgi:5-methylcytosine-specific restriction endonuclease McrA
MWTEGRRQGFITSVIRKGFTRWPAKFEVLKNAKLGKYINESTKRISEHYRCAICQGDFPSAMVEVDHITPVVSTTKGWTSWDSFIDNLFCDASNLQVICKTCHKKKTKLENEERRKQKGSI